MSLKKERIIESSFESGKMNDWITIRLWSSIYVKKIAKMDKLLIQIVRHPIHDKGFVFFTARDVVLKLSTDCKNLAISLRRFQRFAV